MPNGYLGVTRRIKRRYLRAEGEGAAHRVARGRYRELERRARDAVHLKR